MRSELAKLCEHLTMEIEHVNCDILDKLGSRVQIDPSSKTVRVIQDKHLQKQHMQQVRIYGAAKVLSRSSDAHC